MKPSMAALAAALTLSVAACDSADGAAEAPMASATPAADAASPAAAEATTPVPTDAPTPMTAAEPLVAGAPAFAVLYPGGAVEGEPTTAQGPAGPGGLVTFTTDDDPDAVVAFYRQRAEAAGLASVMSMNQGDARAYGAARTDGGARVEVVASPVDAGRTSVQLTWSAGK